MPKRKTHKGLQARIRVTRRGKLVRRKSGKSHLMSSKNAKRRRALSRPTGVDGRIGKTMIRALSGG
ncbi:MAG TPA: 50S ribosomal protein L35 [Planctomycetota bacterium]|nr:50S ribosomal protein L35 [Planctomycetota bacterium]